MGERIVGTLLALMAAVALAPLFLLVELVAALREPQAYLDASLWHRYQGAVGRVAPAGDDAREGA